MLLDDPVCLRRVLPRLSDHGAQTAPAGVAEKRTPIAVLARVASLPIRNYPRDPRIISRRVPRLRPLDIPASRAPAAGGS